MVVYHDAVTKRYHHVLKARGNAVFSKYHHSIFCISAQFQIIH